jgi:predicted ATPase
MSKSNSKVPTPKKLYPFISQWRIENFKSVRSAKIDLAPLTVLVGPNSAGKSSLIHSILLFAQNSRRVGREFDGNARGQIILNGDLVKLGTIEESHCDLAQSAGLPIRFGATYTMSSDRRGLGMLRRIEASEGEDNSNQSARDTLTWDLSLVDEPGLELSGTASVDDIQISLAFANKITETMNVQFTDGDHLPPGIVNENPNFSDKYLARVELKKNQLGSVSDYRTDLFSEFSYPAVKLSAGLPVEGSRLLTRLDRELESQKKLFSTYGFMLNKLLWQRLRGTGEDQRLDKPSAEQKCINLLFEKLESVDNFNSSRLRSRSMRPGLLAEDSPVFDLHLIKWESLEKFLLQNPEIGSLEGSPTLESKEVDKALEHCDSDSLNDELHLEMMEFWSLVSQGARDISPKKLPDDSLSWLSVRETTRLNIFDPDIFQANLAWGDQLGRGVLYLEPLREAPKANYTYSSGGAISPQIPIGSKGEYLAQRLYERRPSIFPLPGNLENRKPMPLVDAVNEWLSFLNIEGQIKVAPQGRSGFLLTVGGRVLPMLGTGISQVLPVITLCLIARRGDLILLEQPELHLNPSMQQLLADFLMAISETDRQVIVETHSEYLVTRLRLNSLEQSSPGNSKILFVEKDVTEGTTYREVKSNEFGEIQDWPAGFFDQASSDYKRLIMKIAQKKQNKNFVDD